MGFSFVGLVSDFGGTGAVIVGVYVEVGIGGHEEDVFRFILFSRKPGGNAGWGMVVNEGVGFFGFFVFGMVYAVIVELV